MWYKLDNYTTYYHTSNSLHAVYKKPYSLLQVTGESISGTTSHVRCIWTCNKIEGLYDKIIITIVQSYTGKNITRLLALLFMLHIRNNTDGNKLVIFSGIALYDGDTYNILGVYLCLYSLYSQYIGTCRGVVFSFPIRWFRLQFYCY